MTAYRFLETSSGTRWRLAANAIVPGACGVNSPPAASGLTTTDLDPLPEPQNIGNPERGFFYYTECHYVADTGSYNGGGTGPLTVEALTAAATTANWAWDGGTLQQAGWWYSTICYRYYYIEFYNSDSEPTISGQYLALVDADIAACRQAGVKLVPRFAYVNYSGDSYSPPYGDAPSVETVTGHATQLMPHFGGAASDVVLAIEAGFIGYWGEWYYTDNFCPDPSDPSEMNSTYWGYRQQVLDAILENTSCQVLLRYPGAKQNIYPGGNNLIGFHNDSFLADANDDYGTYTDFTAGTPEQLEAYLAAQTGDYALMMMGETDNQNSPNSDWPSASAQMAEYHWTSLNPEYLTAVYQSWGEGNLALAQAQLGYQLIGSSVAAQQTLTPGSSMQIELTFTNNGYSAPVSDRGVSFVLDNQAGSRYNIPLSLDFRQFTSGGTFTLWATFTLPLSMPYGTYVVAAWFPDSAPTILANPSYAVQLSNEGVWNSGFGYNELATLQVGAPPAVNYFPVVNGGYSMWEPANYNGPQYQDDMETAAGLGFTTMRVILAAQSGEFDFPTPTTTELGNWANFYGRAKTVGMKIHLTLFDYFGNYGHIDDSKTWINAVLGALPDFDSIVQIETQNEAPFYYGSDGDDTRGAVSYSGSYDAGWTLSESTSNLTGYVATIWTSLMIPYIRSVAPGIPVTASCGYGYDDLAAWYEFANGQAFEPDWWDWHCYPGLITQVWAGIQQAISVTGNNPAKLAFGETGYTTAPTGTQGTAQAQQYQADFLQTVRWTCARLGLPDPSPWILFDIEDCPQFSPSGQTFGLYTTADAIKISGQMYQSAAPGSAVPPVGLNGTMQGTTQTDTNGNTLPPRWFAYKGQGIGDAAPAQPITITVSDSVTYDGNPTVVLTASSSGMSNDDNSPALQANPCTLPLIYPGTGYTFSIALQASGNYQGTGISGNPGICPYLEVSWYDGEDNYLSSTSGAQLTLTGSFAVYSLNATAPADAANASLFLNAGYNAGTIWAGGATWAVA
jgi:Domain of unknown function (DUF4832)/Domain of unknown function (DUF4874)